VQGRTSVAFFTTGPTLLEVAAVTTEAKEANGPVHCRAEVAIGDSSPPLILGVDVSREKRWTERSLSVPSAPAGATLTLSCDESTVVWAQPLLLPAAAPAPLVVLLSLDTLRADHVTGFAEPAIPTPALAAIGGEGLRFRAAASPYTWTYPSHFALFYSHLYGFSPARRPLIGLAEALGNAGYATAGFTGGGFVGAEYHFERGFDRYAEYDSASVDGNEIAVLPSVLADAERWIDGHAASPSFLFLHTYAVHQVPPGEREQKDYGFLVSGQGVTPEKAETARRFYGDLVGRLDAALTPFFDRLRRLAAERPVLLVVLSDHGEAFSEHHNFRHGSSGSLVTLHDELVHVPMMFWSPGIVKPGRESKHPFSLLDVAPTLYAALGVKAPAGVEGRDFWPLVADEWGQTLAGLQSDWSDAVVSYRDTGMDAPAAWSMRTAELKRIVSPSGFPGVVTNEVYDLAADPAEKVDLAAQDRVGSAATAMDELGKLLRRLGVAGEAAVDGFPVCPDCALERRRAYWASVLPDGALAPRGGDTEPELDPDTRKRLQALGYLN
jgi:arylsulfatase A-like enzyme